jgi:DNA repair photolyase
MPENRRDDCVHPLLRRARALSQTTLEGTGPGRSSYGATRMLETTGAGGLTDFTMGGNVSGMAWSLNPYAGCAHACSYCYVPDTIHAERARWGTYVVVKKDLPTRLARMMSTSGKRTVYLSTSTDPYQAAEAEHCITRRCLGVLVRRDWPVEILTRSPLVLRDVDLLRQLSQVRIGFSIPTMDDAVRRVLEPRAPAIAARLVALRKLSEEGIPTFANYTPACPQTTHDADEIARTFLEAGAQWVNSTPWRRRSTTLGPVWEKLRETEWEWMTQFFANKNRQHQWHGELRAAFKRLGMPLGGGFFNAPFGHARPEPFELAEFMSQKPRVAPEVVESPMAVPHPGLR